MYVFLGGEFEIVFNLLVHSYLDAIVLTPFNFAHTATFRSQYALEPLQQ